MSRLVAKSVTVKVEGRQLLDGISLDLEPGALVGLIGPNGAGKSTLLRCLAGLQSPSSGSVDLGGTALAALPPRERGRRIGYLPQTFQPAWDYTVREIVELGASRTAGAFARLPGLLRDHELAELADRPWSRISGGERARALLGATLVAEPTVLLADEPGASLDIGHRIDLMRRLHAYAADHIVVVVLHDIERAVRDCDRLILLKRGRIVRDGAAASVACSPDLDRVFGVRFGRRHLDPETDAVLMVERGV
ncbi:ABC transporter ATP-binding protein [Methylobacterium nodulans]|uniref:ABC transporter related n=1 Tax=Methylobacterium nodulans (strain LMG 21967 / CNCM I-2342 / ORS 2060) TaxID=460265 RepID=B8ILY0_METNO|nr:ABC transporter ATP-binding protein [Methylobacterium nodulans]ACL56324.1 ABC transporter related [Methylobacterium nodulans ORS 2060]